jgi:hypothetical protein
MDGFASRRSDLFRRPGKAAACAVANPTMSTNRPMADRAAAAREVVEWRRGRLLAAGFPVFLAADLAEDCSIDIHALLALTDRGCPPELAVRICAPLEPRRRPC